MLYRLTALLFLFISTLHADNKVIYLISPPRSLSTVFTRMMYEYKEFEIFHEPGYSPCGFTYYPQFVSLFYPKDALQNFEELKSILETSSKKGNVFVKEIGCAAPFYLLEMKDLLQSKDTHFVFLIRDPHHVVISHYKKLPVIHPLLNDVYDYQTLYELYESLKTSALNPPLVLLAEDLSTNPEDTVRQYCNTVGLPFDKNKLHWAPLGESFSGKFWHDDKLPHQFLHWHKDALLSTGFTVPSSYAIDENGSPTFEEIANSSHREFFKKLYNHNFPYYELFKEIARQR